MLTGGLQDTINQLNHRGLGLTTLDQAGLQAQAISTGIASLDAALGIGGLPRGRVVDLFGGDGCGKTTICLRTIAQAQKNGGYGLIIDTEHALDVDYAIQMGVEPDRLYLSQPQTSDEALSVAIEMLPFVQVLAIDSAAALCPNDDGATYGAVMSRFLRRVIGPAHRHGTLVIITNQLRQNPAILFGPNETATGGKALKHFASVRIRLEREKYLRSFGTICGQIIRATVIKNRVHPPFKTAEFPITWR